MPTPYLYGGSQRSGKIVCTIGPASADERTLKRLIKAGMNVARLNFSHGSYDSHRQVFRRIRKVSKEMGVPVCILQDLQGPKIRTGTLKDHEAVELKAGEKVEISVKKIKDGSAQCFSTDYKKFVQDVKVGRLVLIDDGRIELKVVKKKQHSVICQVMFGGWLKEHKGINLPGTEISTQGFTTKDKKDLDFGLKLGVDAVALSFVRDAKDVDKVQSILRIQKKHTPLICKIERPEALVNIREIMERCQGIMIARGDLGIEIPAEQVPHWQKMLISRANEMGKIVITATQMLESMTQAPKPTRAEVTDVANAIYDGTDAVMLSGETASGRFPVKAVEMMHKIIVETEQAMAHRHEVVRRRRSRRRVGKRQALVNAAQRAADDLQATCMAVFTRSGRTAVFLSKTRPSIPIVAFVSQTEVNRMAMIWGVTPLTISYTPNPNRLYEIGEAALKKLRIVKKGAKVVMIAGTTTDHGGSNVIKIHEVE